MTRKCFYIACLLCFLTQLASAQAFYREFKESRINREELFVPDILVVYPNPATNNVNVVLNYFPVRRVIIDLFDYNGRIRRSFAFAPGAHQLSFDVSFLEAGQYIIRVRETARWIGSVKLVKN